MLIPQLGYGGAEKSFIRLANYLSQHFTVTIALFDKSFGSEYSTDMSVKPNSEIIIQILGGSNKSLISRWFHRWKNFRKIKSENDASISFLSGTNFLNVISGTSTPSIVSERGSKKYDILLKGWKRFLWLKILDPFVYKFSDAIVSVSHGLSGELMHKRQKLAHKIVTIEGYIDSKKLIDETEQKVEEEFAAFRDFPVLIAAGRFSQQKGYKYLIQAFANVIKKNASCKLIFIGDGPDKNQLIELSIAENLKVSQVIEDIHANIFFMGYKKNPSRYFKFADIFLFPSLYEGLPNILIEALASGIFVIAADCPWGVRSVLGDSNPHDNFCKEPRKLSYGWLMPMINTDNAIQIWSEIILETIKNNRYKASEAEPLRAIERFDINNTGKSWIKLLENVIKG